MLVPHHALYPVRKAYREVYAELGPGLEKERYIEALAQRLKDTNHHFETNAELPCSAGGYMHADLTYAHRKVYILVGENPRQIPESVCNRMQFRLKATGIPMGIILNFGREEPEYRQVTNMERLIQMSRKRDVYRRKGMEAEGTCQSGAM
jgi:GxxExxY protein